MEKAYSDRPEEALYRKPIDEIVSEKFVKHKQAHVPDQIRNHPRLAHRAQESDRHDLGQELRSRVDHHEHENQTAPSRGDETVKIRCLSSLLRRGVVVYDRNWEGKLEIRFRDKKTLLHLMYQHRLTI